MEETTQSRGRGRPKGTESTHVMIRMPNDLLAQIDAYAETLEAQIGISDVSVSRAMAIRELCKKGLQSLMSVPKPEPTPASHTNGTGVPAPQPPTQPAIPLALEPAPTTAQPVDVPQAAETPKSAVQTVPTKRTQDLPQHIQTIAEVAAQYDKLSLAQLAELLYERNIYRAKDRTSGEEKPVNRGTLTKWLEQARAAGML
jgi:hypothetical protein